MPRDYYDVLGVGRDADEKEIRKVPGRQRYDAAVLIREAALSEDPEKFAAGQARLVDDPSHDRAMYDADRQPRPYRRRRPG
jgi:hypothetical protein